MNGTTAHGFEHCRVLHRHKHDTNTSLITNICIFFKVLKNDLCAFEQSSNASEVQVAYKRYSDIILLFILPLQNKANRNVSCAGSKITQYMTTGKANLTFSWHCELETFSQHLTHLTICLDQESSNFFFEDSERKCFWVCWQLPYSTIVT